METLYTAKYPDAVLNGEHLEKTIRDGGFTDITVRREHIYFGDLVKSF